MDKLKELIKEAEYLSTPRDLRILVFKLFPDATLYNDDNDAIYITLPSNNLVMIERASPPIHTPYIKSLYHTSNHSLIIT